MLDGIKAVLFDLDGTLVDSMWMWGAIDVEYLGRHGLEVPAGLQQAIEGMSFSETAIYFKERFCLPDSLDVIKADWISMSREKYAHEVPLKPGAREFLEYLKAHGIKAGIATSNGRELLDAVVEGQKMTPYFQCLMTSCEAGAGKPAPDIYLKVAAELGVAPEDCLVFEDTPAAHRPERPPERKYVRSTMIMQKLGRRRTADWPITIFTIFIRCWTDPTRRWHRNRSNT